MAEIDQETFKEFVRSMRGDTSQNAFAIRLGVPAERVRAWESGTVAPTDDDLQLIVESSGLWTLEEFKTYLHLDVNK